MKKLAVVAFGGNALLRGDQKGTISEQEQNVYDTCSSLLELIKNDYNLVITHGNGPQVGNILLQNIAGSKVYGLPEMPLDICGAYSQGFIGYMIDLDPGPDDRVVLHVAHRHEAIDLRDPQPLERVRHEYSKLGGGFMRTPGAVSSSTVAFSSIVPGQFAAPQRSPETLGQKQGERGRVLVTPPRGRESANCPIGI